MAPRTDQTHPNRRLVILAGAHKTASSHLQHSLLASQDALSDVGVALIGPKNMRQDLTPFSQLLHDGMTPGIVQAGVAGFLDHYSGTADTVALMDENILGGTDRKMLMRKGRLYPWAPRRIARLLHLLDGQDVTLTIAVRNPATFLPSCWSESLHHRRHLDFKSFTQGFDAATDIWSALVDRILTAAPGTRLTLWRYEDYDALWPSLFDTLLKPAATPLITPDPQRRRTGLSAKAAAWFQAQPVQDKTTVHEARERFPKTGPQDAYIPWTDDELAALNAAYEKDITQLMARDDVTVLRPQDSGA